MTVPQETARRVLLDSPRIGNRVAVEMLKRCECNCLDCQQLVSWLTVPESIRQLTLPHVDSFTRCLAMSECDECLAWLQMLGRRAGESIRNSDVLDLRQRWDLENIHTQNRNWVDGLRCELWFFNSLATCIGKEYAKEAIAKWGDKFDLYRYLAEFDDYSGLPFSRLMRMVINRAALDFCLHHKAEIKAWGRT